MLPDKKAQPFLARVGLRSSFKAWPGHADQLVAHGNHVRQRQLMRQIKPSPGPGGHRDSVYFCDFAKEDAHSVPRHSCPADPGKLMGLAEVDRLTAAQPRRKAEPGQ
jgi:hypothetical protein